MNAIKFFKQIILGERGIDRFVGSHLDRFPTITSVKKAIEGVIGKLYQASTTDAVAKEMSMINNVPENDVMFVLSPSTAVVFKLKVAAYQTGGSAGTTGDSAMFEVNGLIKRDANNNTTLVGSEAASIKDVGADEWVVTVAAEDTEEALSVKVTGEANKNISWKAYVEYLIAS